MAERLTHCGHDTGGGCACRQRVNLLATWCKFPLLLLALEQEPTALPPLCDALPVRARTHQEVRDRVDEMLLTANEAIDPVTQTMIEELRLAAMPVLLPARCRRPPATPAPPLAGILCVRRSMLSRKQPGTDCSRTLPPEPQ